MPNFNYYSQNGVTLMVEFKCQRKNCNNTYVGLLEQHTPKDEGSGYLHNIILPREWSKHWCGLLLCPSCTEHIRAFLNDEEVK